MNNAVHITQQGPVTLVTLSRPNVHNAVDAATARQFYGVSALGPGKQGVEFPARRRIGKAIKLAVLGQNLRRAYEAAPGRASHRATKSCRCASAMSREMALSARARDQAKPELVVASALKPRLCR